MAKDFLVLALDISFRCCTLSKQGSWTPIQENGSSLLRDVISGFHAPTKSIDSKRLQNRCIFFLLLTHFGQWSLKKGTLCKAQPFSESLLFHPKMNQAICKTRKLSLFLYTCFELEWNNEMTSQSKLDPFSCIVVHGPRKPPTSLLCKGTTSEGKMQGQKLFRQSNQGSNESSFMWKRFWALVVSNSQWLRGNDSLR